MALQVQLRGGGKNQSIAPDQVRTHAAYNRAAPARANTVEVAGRRPKVAMPQRIRRRTGGYMEPTIGGVGNAQVLVVRLCGNGAMARCRPPPGSAPIDSTAGTVVVRGRQVVRERQQAG